jgi:hypothetical protein
VGTGGVLAPGVGGGAFCQPPFAACPLVAGLVDVVAESWEPIVVVVVVVVVVIVVARGVGGDGS